jgi:hypothetical protein
MDWLRTLRTGDGMATGKKPASDSGKLLAKPATPAKVKEVAASDLAQAKKKPEPPKKKK